MSHSHNHKYWLLRLNLLGWSRLGLHTGKDLTSTGPEEGGGSHSNCLTRLPPTVRRTRQIRDWPTHAWGPLPNPKILSRSPLLRPLQRLGSNTSGSTHGETPLLYCIVNSLIWLLKRVLFTLWTFRVFPKYASKNAADNPNYFMFPLPFLTDFVTFGVQITK